MPWIKDMHNIDRYIPSLYTKNELPTWDEVYNEFYKKELFFYDPKNPKDKYDLDPYWKIPRKLYLFATICNQFNKMLFENNYKDTVINFVNMEFLKELNNNDSPFHGYNFNLLDIRCKCGPPTPPIISKDNLHKDVMLLSTYNDCFNIDMDKPPMIYTLPHPKNIPDIFITNNHKRQNISQFTDISCSINLLLHVNMKYSSDNVNIDSDKYITIDKNCNFSTLLYRMFIDIMIDPFKKYFENIE